MDAAALAPTAPSLAAEAAAVLIAQPAAPYTAFVRHAPEAPGVVAVVVGEDGAADLGLEPGTVLAVDAAPRGLCSREARAPFQSGRTAVSPLRQALAGLLVDALDLRVEPTSPGAAGAGFALTPDSEDELTAWMRRALRVRAWAGEAGAADGGDADVEAIAAVVREELRPVLQPWARDVRVFMAVGALASAARGSSTL